MSTATITQQQLSTAIARLQDLGDRLETAEALSESHVQPKDWLIAAQAAQMLQMIRNGFCTIEQPYIMIGIDLAAGPDITVRSACHAQ